LLSPYGAIARWQVAGYYYVGIGRARAEEPGLHSIPGVTLYPAEHLVVIEASNITLDGYDFSLNGGGRCSLTRNPAANLTVKNSLFVVGANNLMPIVLSDQASHASILNCTIDGLVTIPIRMAHWSPFPHQWLHDQELLAEKFSGDNIRRWRKWIAFTIEQNLFQNGA